jgi:hypothetical protein
LDRETTRGYLGFGYGNDYGLGNGSYIGYGNDWIIIILVNYFGYGNDKNYIYLATLLPLTILTAST